MCDEPKVNRADWSGFPIPDDWHGRPIGTVESIEHDANGNLRIVVVIGDVEPFAVGDVVYRRGDHRQMTISGVYDWGIVCTRHADDGCIVGETCDPHELVRLSR